MNICGLCMTHKPLRIADDWTTPSPGVYLANALISYLGMLPNIVYTSASATNSALWPICCVLLETSVYMGLASSDV